MKSLKYYLMALAGIAMLNACSDDDPVPATRQWTFRQNLLQPCSETVCLLQSRHRTQMYPFPR